MKNLNTLIFLSVLATALGMFFWPEPPEPPPEFIAIQISSTPAGLIDTVEINGEPFDWQKAGEKGLAARLEELVPHLPKERPPQFRFQIDDRLYWGEIRSIPEVVAGLQPEIDLVIVKTLGGDITPGEDIRFEIRSVAEDDILLPDIYVDLVAEKRGKPVQISLGFAHLGTGEEGRAKLTAMLRLLMSEVDDDLATELCVDVHADANVPFGEIRKTLLAARWYLDQGQLVTLVPKSGIRGIGSTLNVDILPED